MPDNEAGRSGERSNAQKLFLSYSKGDAEWRVLFEEQLRSLLSEEEFFVDNESLRAGANWRAQLVDEMGQAKCALLLLTPQYLEIGKFARDDELPMLLEEHRRATD